MTLLDERPITDALLHAFVDGQLDDVLMTKVEAYLDKHPERIADLQTWTQQNAAIQKLYTYRDIPPKFAKLPE
ncbi:anti-sigma factor family protein [Yoonia maritima]|uniref:anti-sigma factor family protein n=1 Tax=Yoonia maritima TaxID=1435347 RepID=UPI000D10E934|nr:hypothetical protein [Yoonia maritima]